MAGSHTEKGTIRIFYEGDLVSGRLTCGHATDGLATTPIQEALSVLHRRVEAGSEPPARQAAGRGARTRRTPCGPPARGRRGRRRPHQPDAGGERRRHLPVPLRRGHRRSRACASHRHDRPLAPGRPVRLRPRGDRRPPPTETRPAHTTLRPPARLALAGGVTLCGPCTGTVRALAEALARPNRWTCPTRPGTGRQTEGTTT
jgi:hypothetical protein